MSTKLNRKQGIACMVFNEKLELLLGTRLSERGKGTWSFPGGKIEENETIIEAAKRELKEETGLEAVVVIPVNFTEDYIPETQEHWITYFLIVPAFRGEPKLMEPNKCGGWVWFNLDNAPTNLFKPVVTLTKQIIDLTYLIDLAYPPE